MHQWLGFTQSLLRLYFFSHVTSNFYCLSQEIQPSSCYGAARTHPFPRLCTSLPSFRIDEQSDAHIVEIFESRVAFKRAERGYKYSYSYLIVPKYGQIYTVESPRRELTISGIYDLVLLQTEDRGRARLRAKASDRLPGQLHQEPGNARISCITTFSRAYPPSCHIPLRNRGGQISVSVVHVNSATAGP